MFMLLAAIAWNCPAALYYVAPNGNDADPGTEARPWLTIQKAADAAAAGDTVWIKTGRYRERVELRRSGMPGAFITLAACPGHAPVLDGENQRPSPAGPDDGLLEIRQIDYVRVAGLRLVNSQGAGIHVDNSAHIFLEGNATSFTWSSGISAWGCAGLTVRGNSIQRACQGDGNVQECLTVSNTDTYEISGNHVWNTPAMAGQGGEGICSKDANRHGKIFGNHVHDLLRLGIYVDGWGSHEDDVEVFGNIVHDAQDGIDLSAELKEGSLSNVRVYNNIVYNNRYYGICITDFNSELGANGDGPKQNITVINNTVYHNGYNAQDWGGGITVTTRNPASASLVVRNNICSGNNLWQIMRVSPVAGALTVENNLIDGANGYADGDELAIDGNYAVKAPAGFVNAGAGDFHLIPGAAAIDSGTASGAPPTDFAGNPRPQDGNGNGTARFDIGACEFPGANVVPGRDWVRY